MDEASKTRYRSAELDLWRANGSEPGEHWVEVPKHGLRVRVLEVGEGRPVLFVHGIPSAGSIWAPLVARLLGRRCLVLDRPGCGLSEPFARVPAAPAGPLVDVQLAVLDALGIDCPDLVGSSFGGASVLWLALAHPDRVGRIVLDGAPGTHGFRPALFNRIMAAGPLGRYVAGRPASRSALEQTFRQVGHRRLVESGFFHGERLAWFASLGDDTDSLRNETLQMQAILGWRGFRRGGLFDPADFPRVGCPALWLWGADDAYATVAAGRAWAASMPDATFEVLNGEGHMPWLDDPERHARRIERFLEGETARANG
jgi:2-hydroxy-6-oxonona-2,4-dienedioate hydrolase